MSSDRIIKEAASIFRCKDEEVVERVKRLVSETHQLRSGIITDPRLQKKIDKMRRKREGQERSGRIRRANTL